MKSMSQALPSSALPLKKLAKVFYSQFRGRPWKEGLNAFWKHLGLYLYFLFSL